MKHYTLLEIQYLQSIYLEQFDMYEDFKTVKMYGNQWLFESTFLTKFLIWLQQIESENQIELLINNYKSKLK